MLPGNNSIIAVRTAMNAPKAKKMLRVRGQPDQTQLRSDPYAFLMSVMV